MTLWELPWSGAFIPTWPSVSFFQGLCGRLSDGPPKHVHSPIPRTSGYVSLSGKGAFAEVGASITLSRGDEPGSFGRTQRHHKVLVKERQEGQSEKQTEAGSGAKGFQAPLETGKGKEAVLPRSLQEKRSPVRSALSSRTTSQELCVI